MKLSINARLDRGQKSDRVIQKKRNVFSDQFSDVACHEINTPLTGVISTGRFFAELLRKIAVQRNKKYVEYDCQFGRAIAPNVL